MGNIAAPPQLTTGFFETQETDEAAILRSLGVEPTPGAECRVQHDKHKPVGSGRGDVIFNLAGRSNHGVATRALALAYRARDGRHGAELDDAIEQITDEKLRENIKRLLPLMVAEYGRSFAEHRQDCMRMVHEAPRFARGRRGDGRRYNANIKAHKFRRQFGI